MNSLLSIFSPQKEARARPAEDSPSRASTSPSKPKLSARKGKRGSARASLASEAQSPTGNYNDIYDGPKPETPGKAQDGQNRSMINAAASKLTNLVADATGARAASQTPKRATPATARKSASKSAASPSNAPASDSDADTEEHAFNGFRKHRWAGDAIEIEVDWADGPNTWEPEASLQRDSAQAVYDYWRRQGGRPAHPTDADLYTVFAVLGHSKDRKKLRVQWTGFGPKDATWETRRTVEDSAPAIAEEYWDSVRASEKKPRERATRGRQGARGRGRGRGGRGRGRGRR